MTIYKSLFRLYQDQPPKEIFARLVHPKQEENWEAPYKRLANMSKDEEWSFVNPRFRKERRNYPILMNYLNYTFLRVQELGLLDYSDNESKCCFNTGLQTRDEKDIFATFFINTFAGEMDQPQWSLFSFADSYSEKLSPFSASLPKVATYIDDTRNLVFDLDYEIEVNIEHIVDQNNERLPDALQDNRTLAIAAIEGATKFLKQKVLRNYKVAIPHWYSGHLQLLLPLNLTSDTEADLALVAERDDKRKIYRIKTALTMDKAYVNARLICRPDRDWLNP